MKGGSLFLFFFPSSSIGAFVRKRKEKKKKKRSMRKLNGVGVTIQWIIMMGRGDLAGFW